MNTKSPTPAEIKACRAVAAALKPAQQIERRERERRTREGVRCGR
jgi:hypothetical protein